MPQLIKNNTLFVILAHSIWYHRHTNLYFSTWRMVAILDLEVNIISQLHKTHFNGFVLLELVGNDILFAFLAHLLPEIWGFMFFKMADGGHFVYVIVWTLSGTSILCNFWYIVKLILNYQKMQKNLLLQFFWGHVLSLLY